MKKLMYLLVAGTLFVFTACSSGSGDATVTEEAVVEEAVVEDTSAVDAHDHEGHDHEGHDDQ